MNRKPESFNYLVKLEKVQSGGNKNLNADVIFKFSKLPQLHFSGKESILLAPGKLESETIIMIGDNLVDFNNKNTVNYVATDESLKYNIDSKITSKTHPLDMKLKQNFELRSNYFLKESVLTISPDYTMTSHSEIRISENNGLATVRVELPSFKLDQKITYTKIAPRHYTAQVTSKLLRCL